MPYYNITLTDNPVQSKNAEAIAFSTRPYWSTDESGTEIEGWINNSDEINMSNSSNIIQVYINKYKTTLKNFAVGNVNVRAVKYSELKNIQRLYRNPGETGIYWIGSGYPTVSTHVYYVNVNGGGLYGHIHTSNHGVRPIIEIPIE